jgi:hypothetical protein
MSWRAAPLPASNLEGRTSVAFIDAVASSRITTEPEASPGAGRAGRASASTIESKRANCNSKSRLRFKRCQGMFAWRSRSKEFQRKMEETGTSRRRSFSM